MLHTVTLLHSVTVPIDIDRFETAPESELAARENGPTNAEQVLSFLAAHADKAFTPKEIRTATDVPRGSIGVVLSRLEERGLVRHRGEYWAIGDAEAVDRELTAATSARVAGERLGTEDPDEWGPGIDPDDGAEDS